MTPESTIALVLSAALVFTYIAFDAWRRSKRTQLRERQPALGVFRPNRLHCRVCSKVFEDNQIVLMFNDTCWSHAVCTPADIVEKLDTTDKTLYMSLRSAISNTVVPRT